MSSVYVLLKWFHVGRGTAKYNTMEAGLPNKSFEFYKNLTYNSDAFYRSVRDVLGF